MIGHNIVEKNPVEDTSLYDINCIFWKRIYSQCQGSVEFTSGTRSTLKVGCHGYALYSLRFCLFNPVKVQIGVVILLLFVPGTPLLPPSLPFSLALLVCLRHVWLLQWRACTRLWRASTAWTSSACWRASRLSLPDEAPGIWADAETTKENTSPLVWPMVRSFPSAASSLCPFLPPPPSHFSNKNKSSFPKIPWR